MMDRPDAGAEGIDSNSPPSTPASRQDPRVLEYARQLREQDTAKDGTRPPTRGAPGLDGTLSTPPDAHAMPPLTETGPPASDLPTVEAQPRPTEGPPNRTRGVYLLGLMARLFLIGAGVMAFAAIAGAALAMFDIAVGAGVTALVLFVIGRMVRQRGNEQDVERRERFGN